MPHFPDATSFLFRDQTLWLHPLRAAYWEAAKTLLISDLHLGKAAHFRKAGIAAPRAVEDQNLDRLVSLLLTFKPERVLLLGDLFHSDYNRAWEDWQDLVQQFKTIQFELVPGNHDILTNDFYTASGLLVRPLHYREGPFLFTHEPLDTDDAYNLCGHIHPGVLLEGGGRQRLRLPCFFFGKNGGILPAFGAFTGLAILAVRKGDTVFGITKDTVLPLT
ncbi:MAG: ligase-associated DNA damage response endonuclease PdeM [Bacteroidota bacterium]